MKINNSIDLSMKASCHKIRWRSNNTKKQDEEALEVMNLILQIVVILFAIVQVKMSIVQTARMASIIIIIIHANYFDHQIK